MRALIRTHVSFLLLLFALEVPWAWASCEEDSLNLNFVKSPENGNYYFYNEVRQPYLKSWANCRNKGADLATVHSEQDWEAVKKFHEQYANGRDAWVGLIDTSGSNCTNKECHGRLEWVDGTEFSSSDSVPSVSKSDEHERCLRIRSKLVLHDLSCSWKFASICQRKCDGTQGIPLGSPLVIDNSAFRLRGSKTFNDGRRICRNQFGGTLIEPRDGSKSFGAVQKIMSLLGRTEVWLGLQNLGRVDCQNEGCHRELTWVSDENPMESSNFFSKISITHALDQEVLGKFDHSTNAIEARNLQSDERKRKSFICQYSNYCGSLETPAYTRLVEAKENALRPNSSSKSKL